MDLKELIEYRKYDESHLNIFEKVLLQNLCKSKNDNLIKVFNISPNHLKKHELIYVSKYLDTKNYSYYVVDDKYFVAPINSDDIILKNFGVPSNAKKVNDEVLKTESGYRNLKRYSISPELKYKLMTGKSMTGYASIDKPWETGFTKKSKQPTIKQNNLLEFFTYNRGKFRNSKDAMICYDAKMSWNQFEKEVELYTKSFSSLGINEGDIVPICTQNIMEAIVAYFALDSIGAVSIFLDPCNTSEVALNKYFSMFNSKLTLVSNKYLNQIKNASVGTNINNMVVISPTDSLHNGMNLSDYSIEYIKENELPFQEDEKVFSLSTFKEIGKKFNGDIKKSLDNSKPSLITSTSGSTGEPKLVVLSRENIMYELLYIKNTTHIKLGALGVNMQVVPFKYPYGFVISTLLSPFVGKTAGLTPDLTMKNYMKFINMYKPTYIHAIPSTFKALIKNDEAKEMSLKFLKYPISGGDFYDYNSIKEANSFFNEHYSTAKIKNGSGCAEVSACITTSAVGKYKPKSVGKPLVGTNIKVVDEKTKEEMPYGQLGLLCYSGKNVMKEYYGDTEATNETKILDKDGKEWIYTDSIGYIDKEGYVYMCGRGRNFFITYGEDGSPYKVYTNYVQQVINSCEGVSDCVVVKKPHEEREFVSKAYIVLKEGYTLEDIKEKILTQCKINLDKCAIPLEIESIPEIIYTEAGKINMGFFEHIAEEEFQNEKDTDKIRR